MAFLGWSWDGSGPSLPGPRIGHVLCLAEPHATPNTTI